MHTEHLFRVHLYYWWALDFVKMANISQPFLTGIFFEVFFLILDGV